jgi:hypothetical protein
MPMTIETGGNSGKARDRLIVEKVALNPDLIDRTFTKPVSPMHRRNGVTVDARPAGPTSPANPSSTP